MGFLKIEDKIFVVFGLANKKSVAAAIAKVLIEEGAKVIHVVRSEQRAEAAKKYFRILLFFCAMWKMRQILFGCVKK